MTPSDRWHVICPSSPIIQLNVRQAPVKQGRVSQRAVGQGSPPGVGAFKTALDLVWYPPVIIIITYLVHLYHNIMNWKRTKRKYIYIYIYIYIEREREITIERDICDHQNISDKFPCVWVCLPSRDLFIFQYKFFLFLFIYKCNVCLYIAQKLKSSAPIELTFWHNIQSTSRIIFIYFLCQ